MPEWTPEQQAAIEAENTDILVSAAAGSGKTAVLVHHILRLVLKGVPLKKMVIVTYTKAAAGEMRERLRSALYQAAGQDNRFAREQAEMLSSARIGTIHSFCSRLVQQYFYAACVDPQITAVDEEQKRAFFADAMERALDELTEEPTEGYAALTGAFTDDEIKDMAAPLYTFILSLPDPFAWLDKMTRCRYTACGLKTHPYAMTLMRAFRVELSGLEKEAEAYLQMASSAEAAGKWLTAAHSDLALYANLQNAQTPEDIARVYQEKFVTAPSSRGLTGDAKTWHDQMAARRKRFKKDLIAAGENMLYDPEKAARDMNAMGPHLEGLRDFVARLHAVFFVIKQEANVMDYDDMIHLTLQILANPAARAEIQRSCDYLFVDEYQDAGGAEEAIFNAIRRDDTHFFMVGDVKQSIYRFRQCDPTLFLSKQKSFSQGSSAYARKIYLTRNFRSRPHIIETVNTVFETLMRENVTQLNYDQTARLYPGIKETDMAAETELYILKDSRVRGTGAASRHKMEGEFQKAAELIGNLTANGLPGRDGEPGLPLAYKDIAILLPQTKNIAAGLAEALEAAGIAAFAEKDEDFYELSEIRRMLDLMRALDNPRRDLPFIAALKLPVFHFSDEDLADIRIATPDRRVSFYDAFLSFARGEGAPAEKCRATLKKLDVWRLRARHLGLHKLLWDMMHECGLYYQAGMRRSGQMRQANLRLLCQHAARYETVGIGGLSGFLRLLTRISEQGKSAALSDLAPGDNLVRIMTIHRSKGLQFPVTIIMGLGGPLLIKETRKLKPHKELGIGIPYVNAELRITRRTLAQEAIQDINRSEDRAERLRLLYVAMTRASEKMILMGTVDDPLRKQFTYSGDYGIMNADCYLDWLMLVPGCHERLMLSLSTGYPQPGNPYTISFYEKAPQASVDNFTRNPLPREEWEKPVAPEIYEKVKARLTRTAPARLPRKISVNAFVKKDYYLQEEETARTKALGQYLINNAPSSAETLRQELKKPSGISAAEVGIAVHVALSKINFAKDIPPQLDALAQNGFIGEQERNAIPLQWLESFAQSDLCRRMLSSPHVLREHSFVVKYFKDRSMLLQGVVDLAFTEGDGWILCDYKSDRGADAATLTERYGEHMRLYAEGLSRVTKQPVKETWLFALRTGEAIRLKKPSPPEVP